MFTIQCTTCGAKLAVKNEELVGQILACPKCGGMVLVERPSEPDRRAAEASVPEVEPKPTPKRFPDLLSETESGIIRQESDEKADDVENPSATSPPQPPPVLSESEIRTRKILLGVLFGLLALVVLSVGALIAFKGGSRPDVPVSDPETATGGNDTRSNPLPPPVAAPVVSETKKGGESPEPEKPHGMEDVSIEAVSVEDVPGERPDPVKPGLDELLALTPRKPADAPADGDEIPDENLIPDEPDEDDSPEIRATTDLLSDIERKLPGLVESQALLKIDIPDRLRGAVVGMKLNRTPLIVALRTISSLTEVPITLDVDELRPRGIDVERPLTETFQNGTFGDLLNGILSPLQLEPVIEDRQVLVTVPEERRDAILERTFDVSDLVAATKDTAEADRLTPGRLREILRRLVDPIGLADAPDSGEGVADRPSIQIEGDSLVVRHRLRMLDESLRILEQLRVLRALPQKTEVPSENLVPEAFGWDAVNRPLTLNYFQPVLLSEILDRIETATGLRILVDHQALHRSLTPLYTIRATVHCDRGTINDAMENLLSSVDDAVLNYRIVGPNTLEITTGAAAGKPEKMSIEIHRYENADSPEEFVRTIKTVLDPDGWFDADDPESVGLGDIVVDRPSGCIFVRQSQPVQRLLRRHGTSIRPPGSTEEMPLPQGP